MSAISGRLEGKRAIVTGACQGIGEAIARLFAAHRATVFIGEMNAKTGQAVADSIVTAGGRVLNVTGLGATLAAARDRAYAAVHRIGWPQGFCRRDIGWRALAR